MCGRNWSMNLGLCCLSSPLSTPWICLFPEELSPQCCDSFTNCVLKCMWTTFWVFFSTPTFLITSRIDFGEKQGQGTQGFTAVELMPIVTGKWNGVVSWKLTEIWIQRFPQLSLSKMMSPLGLQYKTDVFLYVKT